MKAVIVDDEKKGREILEKFISTYCPAIQIEGLAASAEEAFALIAACKPDLVFLDIQMPNGNGFDLLERFDNIDFQIIFVTAHDHYAIKAIKHHALDYLLKPIDIDELRAAVEKAEKQALQTKSTNKYEGFIASRKLEYTGRITVAVKEGIVYIPVSEVVRVESDLGCSVFYTIDGKKYVATKNLKDYEEILPGQHFFRIHKSHLINVHRVKKYLRADGFFVEMSDGSQVEIARRKKDEFLRIMEELA